MLAGLSERVREEVNVLLTPASPSEANTVQHVAPSKRNVSTKHPGLIALPGVSISARPKQTLLCSASSLWELLSSDSQKWHVGEVFSKNVQNVQPVGCHRQQHYAFYRKIQDRKFGGSFIQDTNCPQLLNCRLHKCQHTSLNPDARLLGWSQALIMNVPHVFSVVVLSEQGVNVGCSVWHRGSCRHREDHGAFTV